MELIANKLTSPVTFSPVDYSNLPICGGDDGAATLSKVPSSKKSWNEAISKLHGDAYYPINSISIQFGYDVFCATACTVRMQPNQTWTNKVQQDYLYNIYLDGLPAIYRTETEYVSLFCSKTWSRAGRTTYPVPPLQFANI
jgi:Endomembrane protein 70